MATHEIIGEWTGPQSPAGDFTRVHHVEHVSDRTKRGREYLDSVRALGRIVFTDGTALILRVNDVTAKSPSQRKPQKLGYRELINKCIVHGVDCVADLPPGA